MACNMSLTFRSTLEIRAEFSGLHFTATAFMKLNLLSRAAELQSPTVSSLYRLASYHQYTSRYTEPDDAVSLQQHFECSEKSPSLTTKALANVKIELEKIQNKTKRSPSKVGFLLKHKYTTKGLQPHLLKGEDKGLNALLIRSGSAN